VSNTILTPTQVTREALRVLHQKLTLVGNINRQYDDSFAKEGAKIGDSLKIRLPNKYNVRTGRVMQTNDTTETSVTLQVATQKGVDLNFTSADLTLSLDDFSKRILQPAMARLASAIEADAMSMYKDVYQLVGTAGTTPNALSTYLLAGARLDDSLAPRDDNRSLHLTPVAQATIVDALKGLFQDSGAIRDQYREGLMGRTAGFDWYSNTLMPTHTNGNDVTGVAISGASQTGSSILVSGVTSSSTFTKGTVFTIANVYEVHPETGASTGVLQNFVITADTNATTTTVTLPISPSIIITGATKTVDSSPADTAALTFVGAASTSYRQMLALHRDAFTFATADLFMPKGVDMAAREVFDGISMRLIRAYDVTNDTLAARLDVLYGYKTIRPELAVRVTA